MICAAIRFAAAISFVPVLRKTTRLIPLIAGGVNRICQSFRPAGGGGEKTSALCCAVRCVVFESLADEAGEARDAPLAQLAEQVTLKQGCLRGLEQRYRIGYQFRQQTSA